MPWNHFKMNTICFRILTNPVNTTVPFCMFLLSYKAIYMSNTISESPLNSLVCPCMVPSYFLTVEYHECFVVFPQNTLCLHYFSPLYIVRLHSPSSKPPWQTFADGGFHCFEGKRIRVSLHIPFPSFLQMSCTQKANTTSM